MKNRRDTNYVSLFLSCVSGDGKTLFNRYIRQLCSGEIEEHPRPVKFKLTKNQMFPEKISVFDAVYDKKNNGQWIPWLEIADKAPLSPNAKVHICLSVLSHILIGS